MENILKIHNETFYKTKSLDFYFENLEIGVIDIETTGLSPDRNNFILGGLVKPDKDTKKTIQVFADSKDEEKNILSTYAEELRSLDVLISYNGNNFDIPFLCKRMEKAGLESDFLKTSFSFDLYLIIRRCSDLKFLLPNLKQKTVEDFLGLWKNRTDKISGAESVDLYYEYLLKNDNCLKELIMLHNEDDILQLSRLMKILDKMNLHEIMFNNGFPVSEKEKRAYIKNINLDNNHLTVSGTHRNVENDCRIYKDSYEAFFSSKNVYFNFKIPIMSIQKSNFIDLNNFDFECTELTKYPAFQSDYLILKEHYKINYAEVNHLIKIVLKQILKSI